MADLVQLLPDPSGKRGRRILLERVDRVPVGVRRHRYIIRRLRAALNFQTGNACARQLRNMFDHAQIARIHNISPGSILRDGHILSRTLFLYQRIFPPARLGAVAAVAVAPRQVIRQQTAARKRNAHRAVHKRFDFQRGRRLGPDLRDLLHAQLARQHNPGRAQIVKRIGRRIVDDPGLGGNMDFHLWRMALHQLHHAEIRRDKRIHPGVLRLLQKAGDTIDFFIGRQGVAGQIDPLPPAVRKLHRPAQLLHRKICRSGAHSKFLSRQIDRIRAESKRCFQTFRVSGWAKKLQFHYANPALSRFR